MNNAICICPECGGEIPTNRTIICRHCHANVKGSVIEKSKNELLAREMPPEITGLNFGAFSLSLPWAIAHQVKFVFVVYIVYLFVHVALIISGMISSMNAANASINEPMGNISIFEIISIIAFSLSYLSILAVSVYLLFAGNSLAWKNRYFRDIAQFKSTQRVWSIVGAGVFAISIVLIILLQLFK